MRRRGRAAGILLRMQGARHAVAVVAGQGHRVQAVSACVHTHEPGVHFEGGLARKGNLRSPVGPDGRGQDRGVPVSDRNGRRAPPPSRSRQHARQVGRRRRRGDQQVHPEAADDTAVPQGGVPFRRNGVPPRGRPGRERARGLAPAGRGRQGRLPVGHRAVRRGTLGRAGRYAKGAEGGRVQGPDAGRYRPAQGPVQDRRARRKGRARPNTQLPRMRVAARPARVGPEGRVPRALRRARGRRGRRRRRPRRSKGRRPPDTGRRGDRRGGGPACHAVRQNNVRPGGRARPPRPPVCRNRSPPQEGGGLRAARRGARGAPRVLSQKLRQYKKAGSRIRLSGVLPQPRMPPRPPLGIRLAHGQHGRAHARLRVCRNVGARSERP